MVRAFFGGTIRRSSLISVGVDVVMRRSWGMVFGLVCSVS